MKAIYVIGLAVGAAMFGSAQADEALAKAKNCLACHTVDKKLVGPAYKDVAKRYAGKKGAEAELMTSVMKGSMTGKWKDAGVTVPMPPNTTVNEAEAKKLVTWILSLK